MRNIVQYPITVEEVIESVRSQREKIGEDMQIGGVDGLCMSYLSTYLQRPGVQQDLLRFLDEVQPKEKNTNLDNLGKDTLSKLLNEARWVSLASVWNADYKGISTRGSHVYDLNAGLASERRLYVRIFNGELRGELNEDDFTISVPHRQNETKEDVTLPVSGLGRWIMDFLK